MTKTSDSNYKWYVLALTLLTQISVMASRMCFPVLFKEISGDLGLSLVSIGAIWGMDPLAGIIFNLPAGLIVDRFGIKRTMVVICLLQGIFAALRGVSSSFLSMAATMFLFGSVCAMTPTLLSKIPAVWFKGKNLGLCQAMIMIAVGVGAVLGTMLSATVFSPLLGGWRNVLVLYGVPPVVMSLLWLVTYRDSKETSETSFVSASTVPFHQSLSHVIRIKQLWFIGLTCMCLNGALNGLMGYLSLYLQTIGWSQVSADSALTILIGVSCIGTLPFMLLSYRIGARKRMLIVVIMISSILLGLMSVANGSSIWVILVINGLMRYGMQALFSVMVLETEGIGGTYAGTALGLGNSLGMLGGFFAPALGNSLASINPGTPFIFWAALSAVSLSFLYFVKDRDKKKPGILKTI